MLNNIRRLTTTAQGSFIAAPANYNSRRMATSRSRVQASLNHQTVEANLGGMVVNGAGGGGYSSSYSVTGKQGGFIGLLDGFLPDDQRVKNRIYRDIYRHDPVAGGAVDIYATMPFSDFYLTGLKDKAALDVYHKSVEKMRMKIMLPAISRDYLIYGRFIGTTVFSKQDNMFSAIMPQSSNQCLSGDTKVLTKDGWKTMYEMAEPYTGKLDKTYQVNGKFYKGTAPYYKGRKGTFKINLENGQHLKGTKDHRVLTYYYSNPHKHVYDTKWVEIGKLKVGDKVAINKYTEPNFVKTREYYEAYFIGVMMGDGTITSPNGNNGGYPALRLFKLDNGDVLKTLQKSEVVSHFTTEKGFLNISFTHRAKELMAKYDYVNKKSVKINNYVQLMGYLSGLIVTDGYTSAKGITVSGAKDYMFQLLDYLQQYGCSNCKLRLRKNCSKGSPSKFYVYKNGKKVGEHISYRTKDMYTLDIGIAECLDMAPKLHLTKIRTKALNDSIIKNPRKEIRPYSKIVAKKRCGASHVYDISIPKIKRFVANGMIVHNCELLEVPIYGMDPLINLVLPESLKKLLANKKDPRVQAIINSLPEHIDLKLGNIPLDPNSTLFIPRRTDTADSIGTSFFERILPIHIMEKAMIRGSTDQVQRRQRAILHITVSGDGDDFVPTIENLESVRDLFAAADSDPTGAIVVTHSGIMPNEVRDGASFFRADELFEYFNSSKYKALGISEAMITGEANFNAMDATLSLFIENLREYRAMLTREIFYEKIFPAIAVANDFTKDQYTVTGRNSTHIHASNEDDEELREYYAVCAGTRHGFNISEKEIDTSELAMPTVSWQKHLRPEGDTAFLSMLVEAQQQNVPVPLAMMASAAGLDINSVLNNLDNEVSIRKRVQKYNEKIAEFIQSNNGDGSEDGGYAAQAALTALASKPTKAIGLFKREYPDYTLPHEKKKNGRFKVTSAKRRKQIYEQQIKVMAEVMEERSAMERAKARALKKPR